MKNISRTPYIYKVTNLETGQYYIGSQCSGKKIGVNYFTSSTNKAFKEGFKTYGEEKYKITIVKAFGDPDECVHAENYMIRDHMQLKDGLCLNRFYCCGGKKIFSRVGTHHSEETRKRISEGLKGRPSSLKGIPLPEETRKRMSLSHKGTHLPEETKRKISLIKKGTHWSEETRKRRSLTHKGIKISIGDNTFDSIKEASKYYNVGRATISHWVKKNQHNAFYIEKCPKI